MKKRAVLMIAIILVALLAVYFTFLYTKKCSDASCFNNALAKCKKTSFVSDAKDAVWKYNIKGKSKNECEINVKLLQLKEGTTDMAGLEGKSMVCSLTLGIIASPQENLEKCHGLLKEEMQKLIINKLHNYIVSNLGQISEELKKAI